MSDNHDAAIAVAQILVSNRLRSGEERITDAILRDQARAAIGVLGGNLNEDQLTADLIAIYNVSTKDSTVLVDDQERLPWIKAANKSNWRYWQRYKTHLLRTLPLAVVEQVDKDTDNIAGQLGDPRRGGSWDRRGLVVGEVQSGKTTNYTALVCKAADIGYKVIIVLTGVHESLRVQTQIRLEEGFLGRNSATNRSVGVGLIDPGPNPTTVTTRAPKGDFKKAIAEHLAMGLSDSSEPLLLVMKKNQALLRNVLGFFEKEASHSTRELPLLIIDDEADNASINTGVQRVTSAGPDLMAAPTAINLGIRKLLKTFGRRAYVGYTATPFANIFIHHRAETTVADLDLFPQNFIVNLHSPSNYFGVSQAFGIGDDADDNASALLRATDRGQGDRAELAAWLPPGHKSGYRPRLDNGLGIPRSLWRAMLSFVLSTAIRKLRGQLTDHNSMLIHVTRFVALQAIVHNSVSEVLDRIVRSLRYADPSRDEVWLELHDLFVNDFALTTARMEQSSLLGVGRLPSWEELSATLHLVAGRIRIKKINGEAQDVLDYEMHKHEGIDVIAIGGDKLSRGLTLEGLTVSYFARPSDTFDTLLQMGRWFGFRPGYLDLCRLYTTLDLRTAFERVAVAGHELREDFDFMAGINMTPEEFGLKVRSFPKLKPTASNKRRHAPEVVMYQTYAGKVSEAKSFSFDIGIRERNLLALRGLVNNLEGVGPPSSPSWESETGERSYRGDNLWTNVPAAPVIQFLKSYATEPSARRANSLLWTRYIETQIKKTNELTTWNVALFGGTLGDGVRLGSISVKQRERAIDEEVEQNDGYRIRRLVTNRDAGIDLSRLAWDAGREFSAQARADGRVPVEPTSSGNCRARQEFGISPLLMIYLPSASADVISDVPVVGVAIAFPSSGNAIGQLVSYTVNSVFLEDSDEDWELTE